MANAGNKSGGTAYKQKLRHLRREQGRQCDRAAPQTTTQQLPKSKTDNLWQGQEDQAGGGLGCQGARSRPNPEFECSCFPPRSQLTGVMASCTEPREEREGIKDTPSELAHTITRHNRESVRTAHMQIKRATNTHANKSGQTQNELLVIRVGWTPDDTACPPFPKELFGSRVAHNCVQQCLAQSVGGNFC